MFSDLSHHHAGSTVWYRGRGGGMGSSLERFPPHACRTCGAALSLYSPGGIGAKSTEYPMPRWSFSFRSPLRTCRSYPWLVTFSLCIVISKFPVLHFTLEFRCLSRVRKEKKKPDKQTNRQTNKQTNILKRAMKTSRLAILTGAPRQLYGRPGMYVLY